eukprot:764079-Hanusia_phi.AAC.2
MQAWHQPAFISCSPLSTGLPIYPSARRCLRPLARRVQAHALEGAPDPQPLREQHQAHLPQIQRRDVLFGCVPAVLWVLSSFAFSQGALAKEKLGDDEFAIDFRQGPLGMDLIEVRFPQGVPRDKQSSRIIVDAVKPGGEAEKLGKAKRLRPQVLVVSINGKNIEGMRANDALNLLREEKKKSDENKQPLQIVFRDPLIFKEKLLNIKEGGAVATQVGVESSEELVITTLKKPDECGAVRAQQGDVLEVKYTVDLTSPPRFVLNPGIQGYLADTMEVFDGSSINQSGNFFGDQSLYFVLNQVFLPAVGHVLTCCHLRVSVKPLERGKLDCWACVSVVLCSCRDESG